MTKIITKDEMQKFNLDKEEIDTVGDFVYLGSTVNPKEDCSQEIRRRRGLRREAMKAL